MATLKWVGGTGGNTDNPATAGNWSTGSAPVSGDDVYIEAPTGSTYNIASNLQGLVAVNLNSLNISQTYTGNIGTAALGTSGYFAISSSLTTIGYVPGGTSTPSGSGMIRINYGTNQHNTTVMNTAASSGLSNAGPVTILGSHTNNTLSVIAGTVSVAADPTESAKLITVNSAGNLTLGTGTTLVTANISSGGCLMKSGITTINQYGGTVTTFGTGTIGTWTQTAGIGISNSSGTITNLTWFGSMDFSQSPTSRTVTSMTANGTTAALNLNNGVRASITVTNNITTRGNINMANFRFVPTTTYAIS